MKEREFLYICQSLSSPKKETLYYDVKETELNIHLDAQATSADF